MHVPKPVAYFLGITVGLCFAGAPAIANSFNGNTQHSVGEAARITIDNTDRLTGGWDEGGALHAAPVPPAGAAAAPGVSDPTKPAAARNPG